ncbi:extensin-like [Girardinichthys multiradiatus]|uniref:extensin-like n=1 Tax=Girardinichthys multiradiatus TaxID=208333 RepID=UPI001FAC75FA|nr:extensin-like [Girardinichthys multiradiatus]
MPRPSTEPKPTPTKKPRPVHPKISHGLPNHADPSNPPPADRTGIGVRNRNLDMEPESKRCPSPPKANHPPPSRKKTYTHPNIRTTPRTHKRLDTPVDSIPPPPPDPPPRQQSEGESTNNQMVPTRQFRRPLRPPMHRRPVPVPEFWAGTCSGTRHWPKTPVTHPPGPKPPRAQPGPQPGGNTAQKPRAPKPIPDLPRSSPATYVRRYRLPKSIVCSHQMPPPRATKASWGHSPQRQTPQRPRSRDTPNVPNSDTPVHPSQCPKGRSQRFPTPTR